MAQFRIDSHQYLPQEKTLFEVVMLADQYGNQVGPANPTGTAVDAFGRARVSTPLTLFDSSHRYADNGLWATSNSAAGNSTVTFSPNEGLVNLAITTANSANIVRETTKVFSYQPGKSLFVLNTFVMEPAKANLTQRVGYYGANNGIFLEQSGNTISFVERSISSGNVVETRVSQADWNKDTLLGNTAGSPSQRTLDLTKAQILWTDIEWLGLGTVRCGFVIDGQLIHCHSFHHANYITSTYMQTASLPIRYEIINTGTTASNSTLKQVCSSVISEGGYELRGAQLSVGTPVETPKDLGGTPGFDMPILSIRLKQDRQDAIVIITALSLLCVGNNARAKWKVIANPTLANTTWTSAGTNSAVEYDFTANTSTGGRVLASGYVTSSTQASVAVDVLKEALFKFQLERNGLTHTSYPVTITMATAVAGDDALATIDWEEISR
jgi:hypothetical protein